MTIELGSQNFLDPMLTTSSELTGKGKAYRRLTSRKIFKERLLTCINAKK